MRSITLGLVSSVLLLAASFSGGCVKNAATGRSIFTGGISRDQEIQIGAQAMPGMVSEMGGKVKSAELQGYVTTIGRQLAAQTEADNPSFPWEFTLLDTKDINAFALPGGKVFIARGLAERMTNEAQLAAVLGHEIGHVTARHTAERIGQSTLFSMGTQVAATVLSRGSAATQELGGMALQIGGTVIPLKFSRDQESEADALGMRYMTRLNYNPVGAMQVMQILADATKGGRQPEFLSTHPYPETRVQRIAGAINGEYQSTQNNPQFQFHEDRFRSMFLKKLGQVPRFEDPIAPLAMNTPARRFEFGRTATWCAHCAAEAH